jgi:putative ABC transport system permease protein
VLTLWLTLFLREALRALWRHKVRSGLTTLGIIVGIAAVVLVFGVAEAGSALAEDELHKLGDNLVWVEAGSRNIAGVRTGTHGTTSLTLEDAQAIQREVPFLTRVSPQIDGTVQLAVDNRNWTTRYRGETPDYLAIKRWVVSEGDAFSDADVEQSASKVLIGQTVRQELFGTGSAVGRLIRLGAMPFEVVGVLAAKGQSADGRDQDDWILLPHTTAQTKIRGRGIAYLDDILCSAESAERVDPAIDRIVTLMRERHHIEPGDEDDFNIRRPEELIKAQIQTTHTLGLLLLVVASISLFVGGIGIMNVMLASVEQRTREIGVRLAIGATPGAVQLQFLGEAIALSVAGGVGGVALSFLGSLTLAHGLGWPIRVSSGAVGVAVLASATVGLFFGLYPARKAAGLDPIAALHHE